MNASGTRPQPSLFWRPHDLPVAPLEYLLLPASAMRALLQPGDVGYTPGAGAFSLRGIRTTQTSPPPAETGATSGSGSDSRKRPFVPGEIDVHVPASLHMALPPAKRGRIQQEVSSPRGTKRGLATAEAGWTSPAPYSVAKRARLGPAPHDACHLPATPSPSPAASSQAAAPAPSSSPTSVVEDMEVVDAEEDEEIQAFLQQESRGFPAIIDMICANYDAELLARPPMPAPKPRNVRKPKSQSAEDTAKAVAYMAEARGNVAGCFAILDLDTMWEADDPAGYGWHSPMPATPPPAAVVVEPEVEAVRRATLELERYGRLLRRTASTWLDVVAPEWADVVVPMTPEEVTDLQSFAMEAAHAARAPAQAQAQPTPVAAAATATVTEEGDAMDVETAQATYGDAARFLGWELFGGDFSLEAEIDEVIDLDEEEASA